jgi:putative intracellular protease/amidase
MDRRTLLTAALGATLAPAAVQAQAAARPKGDIQVAMLLYPEFTALDLVGPYHFLGATPGVTIHLVTNQRDLKPVASDIGLAIQPTHTLADCPKDMTVLFTPGGLDGTLDAARDPETLAFFRDRAPSARFVTSVCTGSLILGAAGLLKGKRATSHWLAVPVLSQFGATPERSRYVRDGNVITGAGVSAGLDFGSAMVAELRGRAVAEAVVLMSEYAPQPPIPGGSIETARPEIRTMLDGAYRSFVEEAKTLRMLA